MEEIKKGPWTEDEDQVLLAHVDRYGAKSWGSIQSNGLLKRTAKSCEFRWRNKLRPGIKRDKFTQEEEQQLIHLQKQYGNKWAKIASYFSGRTDNQVKNWWNNRQKKMARAHQAFHDISNNDEMAEKNLISEGHQESGASTVATSSSPKEDLNNNNMEITEQCNNPFFGLSVNDFISFDTNDGPTHNEALANSNPTAASPKPQQINTDVISALSCDDPFYELSLEDFILMDTNETYYFDLPTKDDFSVQVPEDSQRADGEIGKID